VNTLFSLSSWCFFSAFLNKFSLNDLICLSSYSFFGLKEIKFFPRFSPLKYLNSFYACVSSFKIILNFFVKFFSFSVVLDYYTLSSISKHSFLNYYNYFRITLNLKNSESLVYTLGILLITRVVSIF
jgi:hypothetical protein